MQAVCIRVHAFFEYSFVVKRVASYRLSVRRKSGTVPNLGGLTTDEYSFVIKCPASRHLPMRRLAGEVARRAGGVSHPRVIPQGEQNGHYGRRKGNKRVVTTLRMANKRPLWPPQGKQKGRYDPPHGEQTAIIAAARETKGHYGRRTANRRGVTPRGCETPSAPDCRHSEVCKSRNSVLLNSFF